MKILITGGAGFIGSNAASRFLRRSDEIVLIDDLRRRGAEDNLEWLRPQGDLTFYNVDVRDATKLEAIIREHADACFLLHLASQVAVTSSIVDPRLDFEVNLLGTFNLLEAARIANVTAPIIFSSSNKVYGQLRDVEIAFEGGRSSFARFPHGISEDRNLDFHSPYGCSKGAADQYVRDYHRIYGLNTVVMRQSCIYGCRQFGVEDQGWVAWFAIAAESGRPITIYGDGRQVRDILYVDDLIDAFEAAAANISTAAGSVYNIGGGSANAVSLLDVLEFLGERRGGRIQYCVAGERPGDQRVYVSDIKRAQSELGWNPQTEWQAGLGMLCEWVSDHLDQLI
jgi:CDP-paratose 2-epimerase